MFPLARRLYETETRLLNRLQPLFLLGLRLFWGYQFFLTGRGKLMNIARTAGFFESLHIPMPVMNAYMAGMTECFGGLLMLLGVASRVTSIPLVVTMLVAYATAHRDELIGMFSNPDGFVSAPPFLFLLSSLIVLVFGPGKFSVDGFIRHQMTRSCSQGGCSALASNEPAEWPVDLRNTTGQSVS